MNVNESDPRSNVHYLGSSENKAWKNFRPVRDLNPWPLALFSRALFFRALHRYHIWQLFSVVNITNNYLFFNVRI